MKKFFILLGILLLVLVFGFSFYFKFQKKTQVIEDPTLRKIKTQGKIVIGTSATYPPMESINKKGNFIGIDIEIAKEIATHLGVKAEFKNIHWDELISFEPLYRSDVDILISSIAITPEMEEKVSFSDPYFNAGQTIVTSIEKSFEIKGLEDLAGKKLGVQKNTRSEIEAKKYTEESLVYAFSDYNVALKELLAGNIDALIIDYPAAIDIVSRHKERLKIVGEPFTQEFYGIATRKEDKVLLEKINEGIRKLKRESKLQKIVDMWIGK